jgi:hypothetical protein
MRAQRTDTIDFGDFFAIFQPFFCFDLNCEEDVAIGSG